MNLYVYDLETKADAQADELHRFRHQVPLARPHGHRLRERRLHLQVRPGHREDARRSRSSSPTTWSRARSRLVKVGGQVTSFEISPDGKRALFGARGDIFTVPAKYGNTRNLTGTPGRPRAESQVVAGRQAGSPTSPTRAARTRSTSGPGRDAAGRGRSRAAPTPTSTSIFWSPDSKKIMWSDKLSAPELRGRRDKGRSSRSSRPRRWEIAELRLVARQPLDRLRQARSRGPMTRIYLYSLDAKKTERGDRRLVRFGRPVLQRATASISSSSRTGTSTPSSARPNWTMPIAPCPGSIS